MFYYYLTESTSLPDDASGSEWYPSLQQDKAGGEAGGGNDVFDWGGGRRLNNVLHPREKLIRRPAAALEYT